MRAAQAQTHRPNDNNNYNNNVNVMGNQNNNEYINGAILIENMSGVGGRGGVGQTRASREQPDERKA